MEYYQQRSSPAEVAGLTHRARLAEGKRAQTNLSGDRGRSTGDLARLRTHAKPTMGRHAVKIVVRYLELTLR